MRILITNDDSISATQLLPLIRWAQKLGDVTTVVPAVEQSGKSHGIQLMQAFKAEQRQLAPDVTVWAVDSTPADCVRFAVMGLHMEFDLVISGVNRGCNMGMDVMYSGTVAAIYEAAALGIPAVAFSSPFTGYEQSVEKLDMVWAYFQEKKLLDQHNLYNVNIPVEPRGFRITRLGNASFSEEFIPMGDGLYFPGGSPIRADGSDPTQDTDACALGYISVTPMTTDRTAGVFETLRELND